MDEFKDDQLQERLMKQRNDINLLSMIESRITEIIQIEDECKRKLPKLFNQRLPRFMRRRAACHDIKRLPKTLRKSQNAQFGSKSRVALMKHHRKTRFQKHKRVLIKHSRCKFKDPAKFLLHKWFAKRFKINRLPGAMSQVPMHNNTKNQRNLYRQTRYGCAYLSLAHMMPIIIEFNCPLSSWFQSRAPEVFCCLTPSNSGFTFCANALKKGRYELVMYLHDLLVSPDDDSMFGEYICPASVSICETGEPATEPIKEENRKTRLSIWVPRTCVTKITSNIKNLVDSKLSQDKSCPTIVPTNCSDFARVRLIGPESYQKASSMSKNTDEHKAAAEDAKMRLNNVPCLSIGRYVREESTSFTYYNTKPQMVDVIFNGREGKLSWYKLVKNRAHLVGGYRDLGVLLDNETFRLIPEYLKKDEEIKN